ncbi:hypothetical protein CSC75_05695 [Pseudoxanthomonas wuyuanensis]|nr:hypothetical protein CSC75_05695 [Pseudoxanthomonas wuyuanensis]
MDLEAFGAFAQDWPAWREEAEDVPSDMPDAELLVSLTRHRPTWELLLTSVAYLLADPRKEAESDASMDEAEMRGRITELADALGSPAGERSVPGFAAIASRVATLPYAELLAGAPRLFSLLEGTSVAAVRGLMRHIYCKQRYPKGGAQYRQCLLSGN